jgi:hypothetical protein
MSAKSTDLVVSVESTHFDVIAGGAGVNYKLRVWCIVCRHDQKLPDGSNLQQLLDAGEHDCPDQGLPLR